MPQCHSISLCKSFLNGDIFAYFPYFSEIFPNNAQILENVLGLFYGNCIGTREWEPSGKATICSRILISVNPTYAQIHLVLGRSVSIWKEIPFL